MGLSPSGDIMRFFLVQIEGWFAILVSLVCGLRCPHPGLAESTGGEVVI